MTSQYDPPVIPECDDASIGEVYYFVGFITFLAHGLEMELANLAVALRVTGGTPGDDDSWDDLFSRHFRKTLGALFAAIRQLTTLPAETEEAIGAAITQRNRLAHHIFREHDEDLMSSAGRRVMIEDLRAIGKAILVADRLIHDTTDRLWSRIGVTMEMRAAAVEEMKARAAARDAAV